jgi:hypothetical protein
MPFTQGDGRRKVTILTTKPANLEAVTATEANAGTDAQWHILKSDYRLSPTGSSTFDNTPLGSANNWSTFGASAAEGRFSVFRDLDATGKPVADSETEEVFDLVREKGTQLWVMDRLGPDADTTWATADEYSIYEVQTDELQESDGNGFIKYVVPLSVATFYRLKKIVAAGG